MKFRALLKHLNVSMTPLVLAILLTVIMTLSSLGLLALSGWFLSAASIAGLAALSGAFGFNILQPSSMIRGLAVSRTLSRYVERLLSHDATLRVVVKLRRFVFDGLIHGIGTKPSNDQEALDRLVQDASVVEGALLRTLLPLIGSLIAAFFVPILAAIIAPEAIIPAAIPACVFVVTLLTRKRGYRDLAEAIDRESRRARNRAIALADGRYELQLAFDDQDLTRLTTDAYQPLADLRLNKVSRELTDKILMGIAHAISLVWIATLPIELPILVALLVSSLGVSELLIPGILIAFESRRVELSLARLPSTESVLREQASHDRLVVQDLTFAPTPEADVLALPLTLSLEPGEHLRLSGPSGIGKTTCLKTLVGLLPARSGSVLRPASTGLVEQTPWLPTDVLWRSLTLGLPTQPTENEFWRALKLVELDSWVNNLPNQERTWIGADGVMPSGGQWRRLAIARLVLQQPILALLDEPTEGLEESLAIRLMERLVDEFKDRILIVVSHRDEAIRFIPHELTLDT